jgi:hypothetical protein
MNKKLIFSSVILVGVVVLAWAGFSWWQTKQAQIKLGVASDKFPYRGYTQEELNKMYPQIKNADVPTRTTPEETYAKFREALKTNNLEMAIEQLSKESEKYEENKKTLEQAYKDGKFAGAYKEYPEKIEKQSMYESIASYYYFRKVGGEDQKTHLSFIKDSNGDWKIDIL